MSYNHCGSKSQVELLDQEFDASMAGLYDLLDQTIDRANTSRMDYSTTDQKNRLDETSQARRSPLAAFLETDIDHIQSAYLESELTPHFSSKEAAKNIREAEKMTRKLFEQPSCVSLECSNISQKKGYLQGTVSQSQNKDLPGEFMNKSNKNAKHLDTQISYITESQLDVESSLCEDKNRKISDLNSRDLCRSENSYSEEGQASQFTANDPKSNKSYRRDAPQTNVQSSEIQSEANFGTRIEGLSEIQAIGQTLHNKEKLLSQQPPQDRRQTFGLQNRIPDMRGNEYHEIADNSLNCSLNRSRVEEKAVQTEYESPKSRNQPNVLALNSLMKANLITNTPPKNYSPLKKAPSTAQLFEENINKYERDIDCMHKFVTQETIVKLAHSQEKQILFESPVRPYKSPMRQIYNRRDDEQDEDPVDKFVVARSPLKEKDLERNLISVYQQVSEVYADGTKYNGEKFLGKRHGKGTYFYKEGYKYDGNWEQDQMSGYGTLWLTEDLKWYEGEWYNNVFHGKGTLYNLYSQPLESGKFYGYDFTEVENGWAKYEGGFNEGAKHGFGSLYFTNGDLYVGAFDTNIIEGRGSYTRVDNSIVVGRWENNKLMETF